MTRITRSRAKLSATANGASRDGTAVENDAEDTADKETSNECGDQEHTDGVGMEQESGTVEQPSGHSDDDDAQYDMEDPMFEPLVLDSVKDEDDTGYSAEVEVDHRESQEESAKEHVCQSESNEAGLDSSNNLIACDGEVMQQEFSDEVKEEEGPSAEGGCEKVTETELKIVSEIKEEGDAEGAEMEIRVKDENMEHSEVCEAVADQENDPDETTMLVTHYHDLCPSLMLPEERCIAETTKEIIVQEVKAVIEKLLYGKDDVASSKSCGAISPSASQPELKAYGCNLCGVTIGHPGRFEIHSNSRKHLQNLRWVNGINLNKEQGQFYCGVCRVSLPGRDVMSSHMKSDRHSCLSKLFNVDEYYATHVMERITGQAATSLQGSPLKTPGKPDNRYKEERDAEIRGVRSGQTPASKVVKKEPGAEQRSQQNVQVYKTPKPERSDFRCDLCGVTVAKKIFLDQHFNGKRHRTQVRLHERRATEQGCASAKIPPGNLYNQGQLNTPNFYEDFDGPQWEDIQQNPIQEQPEINEALCSEQGQYDVDEKVQHTSEGDMHTECAEQGQGNQGYSESPMEHNCEGRLDQQDDEARIDGYKYDTVPGASSQPGNEEDEQHFQTEQSWNDESQMEQTQGEEQGADINDENICIEEAEDDVPGDNADDENAGAEEEPQAETAGSAPCEGATDAVTEGKDMEETAESRKEKERSEDKSRRDSRRDSHHRHGSNRDSHGHPRSDSRREPVRDSRRASSDNRSKRQSTSSSRDAKRSDSKDKDSRSGKSDAKEVAKAPTRGEPKTKSSTEPKEGSKRSETSKDTKGDSKVDPKTDSRRGLTRASSDVHPRSHSRDHKSTPDSRHRKSPRPRSPRSNSRDQKSSGSALRRRSSPALRDSDRGIRRRDSSPDRSLPSKKPKYSCFACKVAIFSDRDYKEHFDSRRHRQEVERREKKEEEERAARRRSSSPRSYRRRDRSRSPDDRWRITAPLVTQPHHQPTDPSFMNAQWLNPAAFLPLQQHLQQHPQQHLAQLQPPQQPLHQLAPAPQHIQHLQQPSQQAQCLPDVFGALPQAVAPPAAQALPLESYTERRPVVAGALDNMILLQQRLLTLASATGGNAGAQMAVGQDYDAGRQSHQNPPQQSTPMSRRPQERGMPQHQSSLRQPYKDTSSYSQSKQDQPLQQVPFVEGNRGRMHQEYNSGGGNTHVNYRSSVADGGVRSYFSQKDNRSPSHGIPAQVTARDSYSSQPFQQSTTNPSSRYGNVLDTSMGGKGQARAEPQQSPLSRNQRSQYMRPGMNSMKAGDVDHSFQYMQKRF